VVEGTVEEFDDAARASVASKFAALASVDVSRVNVTAESASLALTVRIEVESQSENSAIASTLTIQLANASAASAFLNLTVLYDPDVSTAAVVTVLPAPPLPPSAPSPPGLPPEADLGSGAATSLGSESRSESAAVSIEETRCGHF